MARQKNDGRGRMGGRQKGTPNKKTTDLKEWITSVLNANREQFVEDLESLMPSERVRVLAGLLNYAIPKQQSMSVESQIAVEYKQLQMLLQTAPDEAIERIAERVLKFTNPNVGEITE